MKFMLYELHTGLEVEVTESDFFNVINELEDLELSVVYERREDLVNIVFLVGDERVGYMYKWC